MANLGPQHINLSYPGLLQVPNGLTNVLQTVSDGNGISSGLQISTTGFGGQLTSSAVLITGGYIDATPIGSNTPSAGKFTSLNVSGLSGIVKATAGSLGNATAGTDYVSPSVLAQPNGVATLDASGYLTAAQIPPIAIVQYLGTVNSQAAMLALTGQQGDWCIRSDLGTTWVITGNNPSQLSSWTQLSYPTAPVTSVNGLTGAVTLSYSNVGAAPATTGSSILYANGSGGFANVTVGTGLTFVGGTLAASSSGTVTSVSVATANGFAGTSSGGSTPALTLSTTVTGLLKGNGTAISAAISGTDYAPATTGTSILKGNGSGGFSNAVSNTDYQSVIAATGILKGAGSGSISAAVVGTDYAPATTGSSILKGNSLGGFANAVSGTDYAPATSGTSILYGNGSGGFSPVTIGSGLTFSIGTLSATSGSGGTVTNVSVVTANGFAGTVANPSTLPAITLSTSVTGLLKGNGTAISAAVSGTDYAPATTGTSILKGNGAGGFSGAISGTDYAPATSGSSILYANGAGGFSPVTIGSNLTFAAGTLSATGGGGMIYPGAGIPNSTGSAWGTSYGTSGANSVALRDANGNISTNSIFEGYSVLVASGTTTTLTAASFPNWYVTGSGGQTFQLPDATTLPNGATYTFNNNQSSGVITLNNNSGSSIIPGGIGSGGYVTLVLLTNVSVAGTWDYHFQTPSNVSWTTNTFNYPGSFTGGTWNGSTVAVNRGGTGVATITGLIKGNGTSAFTAAAAGTDYAPATSGTSILKGNGAGGFASATAGTDYSAGTSSLTTGILKSTTSTGALSIAVSGSDYAPATSGSSILYGNGAGGFSNVTVGTGLTFTAGTLASTGGGSVTITNDTTTSTFEYPLFANATSGTVSTVYTSNTSYLYKPSTGELQAPEVIASNGLIVNSATVSASYSIPSGNNAMSAGPVAIASGQTVTVPSGSIWVVV